MAKKFLTPLDLGTLEIQNAVIQNLATGSLPASPAGGRFAFDSTTNQLKYGASAAWVAIEKVGGPYIAAVGAVGAPGFSWSGDTNTGFYHTAAGETSYSGSGTQRAIFRATGIISNVTDPSVAQDVATKNYVDSNPSIPPTLDWKQSVRVVSVANATLATAYENGDIIDGVTLVTGDRILLVSQSTAAENGIYTVNASGAPTRTTDAATSTQLSLGARVFVEAGTAYTGTMWTFYSGTFAAQLWQTGITLGSGTWGSISFTPAASISGSGNNLVLSANSGTMATLSGTGLGLGVRTTPAAILDLPSSTAAAGGIAFGANEFQLYRSATNTLKLNASAGLDMTSAKIINVLDPTSAQEVATKNYVDTAVQGLDPKASSVVATVGTETFTVAAGAVTQIAGTTVDGISPAVNDRILIKDAPASTGVGSVNSSQPGNGIYTVTNATTNLTVARAADFDAWAEVPGAYTWVERGTVNADTAYISTADQGGTINTTAVKFVKFANATASQSSYYSALGSGSGTTITITQSTHQLRASRGIFVQVQEEATGNVVDTEASVASNGDVTVTFAVSQTLTGFRVTLIG